MRITLKPRYWHVILCVFIATAIFILVDYLYIKIFKRLPNLTDIRLLAISIPLLCGCAVTLFARGAALSKRIISAIISGISISIFHTIFYTLFKMANQVKFSEIAIFCLWQVFIFTIFSTIGALLTEVKLPETWKG